MAEYILGSHCLDSVYNWKLSSIKYLDPPASLRVFLVIFLIYFLPAQLTVFCFYTVPFKEPTLQYMWSSLSKSRSHANLG